MFGADRRARARVAKLLEQLELQSQDACARERAALERLTAVEREHFRTQHKLATVTEVAGEMATKRLSLERDLALTRAQLKSAMSLLETVRSVPELVLDIANEGRMERISYERAELVGMSREVESVQQVHAILIAMKSSRAVSDARERLMLERISSLQNGTRDVDECVDVLSASDEDTRKVKVELDPGA